MTEEAFLEALKDDPSDTVTRLVYADWMDDHGCVRAAFLRAEAKLVGGEHDEMKGLVTCISEVWGRLAGRRWDVQVLGYAPQHKIHLIKAVREITGCGLAEGKGLVESLPARILVSVWLGDAVLAWRRLCDSVPSQLQTLIVPCPEPAAFPMTQFGPLDLASFGLNVRWRAAATARSQQSVQ